MGPVLFLIGLSVAGAGPARLQDQAIVSLSKEMSVIECQKGAPVAVWLGRRKFNLTGVSVPMKPLRAKAGKLSVEISTDGSKLVVAKGGKKSTVDIKSVNSEAFRSESLWPGHKSYNNARYTNGQGGGPYFMQVVASGSRVFVSFRVIAAFMSSGTQSTFAYGLLMVETPDAKPKLLRAWAPGDLNRMLPTPVLANAAGKAWAAVKESDDACGLLDLGAMKVVKSGLPPNFSCFVGDEAVFYRYSVRDRSATATIVNLKTLQSTTRNTQHYGLGPLAAGLDGALLEEWWGPLQFYEKKTQRFWPARFKDE